MSIKYPKGEIVWCRYCRDGELLFAMTSKPARDFYYLYKREGDGMKKLGRSKDPRELEKKYKVYEEIGV